MTANDKMNVTGGPSQFQKRSNKNTEIDDGRLDTQEDEFDVGAIHNIFEKKRAVEDQK